MTHSSTPGSKPSVSSRLKNLLAQQDEQQRETAIDHIEDEFDRLIQQKQLGIVRFVWIRELDLALFVLTNRRIISQTLSAYASFPDASDEELAAYTISASGIHWPKLDLDISLRGLLMGETPKAVMTDAAR